MASRKDTHIQLLGLIPLSLEGGYFKETYRSLQTIQTTQRDGGERSLLTIIYFLLDQDIGGRNYINKNKSDATHFFHDGWPAKYITLSPEGKFQEFILGPDVSKGHVLQLTVPGGYFKASRILVEKTEYAKFPGEVPFSLISEVQSPGFDYRDRCVPSVREFKEKYPNLMELWSVLEEYVAPEKDSA